MKKPPKGGFFISGSAGPCPASAAGGCSAGLRPAPAEAKAKAKARAALGYCWLGGPVWVGRTRRKPPSGVLPSRWRLCVRALAKQCFASKAPSPMGARWRHPWRQRSCQPTPPHPRQFPGDGSRSTPCVDGICQIDVGQGSDPFSCGEGSDPGTARDAAFALALLFFSVAAGTAGMCQRPGGWVARGREPHGCGDRASRDGFTASPAQPTRPARPPNPTGPFATSPTQPNQPPRGAAPFAENPCNRLQANGFLP